MITFRQIVMLAAIILGLSACDFIFNSPKAPDRKGYNSDYDYSTNDSRYGTDVKGWEKPN